MVMTVEQSALQAQRHSSDIGRADTSAKAYRAARRHSRLVKLLRIAIPVGAALSFSVFIVFPFINPFRSAGVSVGAIKMDGTRVTMEQPRLAGHRKDNKPYEVTAVSAVQDIRVPNVIELNQMTARLVNSDDSVLNLTSRRAMFDTQKEQLQLRDDVRVTTQNGHEALMRSADVDFKAGTVQSRDGVRVRLPDMNVSADELDIVDSGGRIAFIGKVTALIDDKDSKALPEAKPGLSAPAMTSPAANAPPIPALSRVLPTASSPAGPANGSGSTAVRDARGAIMIDPNTGRAITRPVP